MLTLFPHYVKFNLNLNTLSLHFYFVNVFITTAQLEAQRADTRLCETATWSATNAGRRRRFSSPRNWNESLVVTGTSRAFGILWIENIPSCAC